MKVFVETYGCSANANDSQIMKGIIESQMQGALTEDESEADTVIINSCAVKGPTERKILRSIGKKSKEGKRIIVAGCMAEAQSALILKQSSALSIVSPDNIDRIGEALHSQEPLILRGKKRINKASLPSLSSGTAAIIQIAQGCDSACTYCLTKAAKGHIRSTPEGSIIEAAERAVSSGKKELWLTSQDNSCYGVDSYGETRLPRLIKRISRIKGDFFIRNGMGNPNNLIGAVPEIIDSYGSDKVYKFLHLPSQSGSNRILKDMRRQYIIGDYMEIVNAFRDRFEKFSISNDIIVGYPTETDEDFDMTMQLIKETRPDSLNISRFWPRPGTYASRLRQLDGSIVKERSRTLTAEFERISERNNKGWLGWEGSALITETGKNDSVKGVNYCYKTVTISRKNLMDRGLLEENESLKSLIGKSIEVRIKGFGTYHLEGMPASDNQGREYYE